MLDCPKCGHAHFPGEERCSACGIVFMEWLLARANRGVAARSRAALAALGAGHRATPWLLGGAALAAAAALLLGLSPAGLPPAAGAQEDSARGFSFVPPPGWRLDGSSEREGALSEAASLSAEGARIQILVGPPSLWQEAVSPAGAERLASSEFNGMDARLEGTDRLEVDRLEALRLRVSGGHAVLPAGGASRASRTDPLLEAAGELVVLPGSGRSYVLKFIGDRRDRSRFERTAADFLAAFRVRERPLWRSGPGWARALALALGAGAGLLLAAAAVLRRKNW
ncbi:MAG: hypothetical protein WC969_11480 [Elusimicrobiota bacterium]|jgi:hypothetical protein